MSLTSYQAALPRDQKTKDMLKYQFISIGSYPIFDGKPRGVEIVINSQVNKLGVNNAKKFILKEINKII